MAKKYKVTDFVEAIQKSQGVISSAAKRLGCSRQTIYTAINDSPTVRQVLEDMREDKIDHVESKLHEQIDSGNMTAIIFFLKTQAKHRGYVERIEYLVDVKIVNEFVSALEEQGIDATEFFTKARAKLDAGTPS